MGDPCGERRNESLARPGENTMETLQPIQPSRSTASTRTRRLLLVDPYPRNNPYHLTAAERRAVWFPKLSLPVIAAYTPESWSVDLVDEAVQDVNFDHP